MAELSPKLHDLREELRTSASFSTKRELPTLSIPGSPESRIWSSGSRRQQTLQLGDALVPHARVSNYRNAPPPSGVVHVPVALATTVLSTEIVNTQGPGSSLGFTFTSSTTCPASPACHTWMVRTAL